MWWANYDIERNGADTSVNYLALEVLERAGVPLDEYRSNCCNNQKTVIFAVRAVKSGWQ